MAIIPNDGVTTTTMRKKVEDKLLKVVGISRIEETYMTTIKGKWLVVTHKLCKPQLKREVERILHWITLQTIHPIHTQPGTISKEHRNLALISYTSAL